MLDFFINKIYSPSSKNKKLTISNDAKFNYLFFVSCFLPLFIIALFNIFIDPYNFFTAPLVEKINKIKPEKEKNFMLFKAQAIRSIKPDKILLGSSRVAGGLNEKHPALINNSVSYNLAFPGANMYEVMRYFQHALAYQPQMQQVIIGVDFFMFNQNLENLDIFSEDRLGKKIPVQDLLNSTLSLDAIRDSYATIIHNLEENKTQHKETTQHKFERWLGNFLTYPGFYGKYQLSSEALHNFRTIVNTCREKNIELIVFISPAHATDNEAIRLAGLWSVFEQWKRELVNITPVWDFSGYNSITTENISEQMVNYVDSSHYSPKTGEMILDKILFSQKKIFPNDFGVMLTTENVDLYLKKINSDRQNWSQENPQTVKLVEAIQKKLSSSKSE